MVYYVEGDIGHLMNERAGAQQFRTAVGGSSSSFQMPWSDILQDLQAKCSDAELGQVPRSSACLKYLLRVHVRLAGMELKKHLKEVHVWPFILILILDAKRTSRKNIEFEILKV